MAARTRINTKFIFILVVIALSAAAVIGGLLALQIRGDAARQMRLGEEMMAQGDIEAATRHFGRAVRRDPANLQYLRTYENAVREVRPATSDAARTYYGRLVAALRQEAQYNPTDPDSHLRYLNELHSSARVISMIAPVTARRPHWEQQANAAADLLSRVPSTDPKHVYGNLYQGMATVRLRASMGESELNRADQELVAFTEARPYEDIGWATLAHSRWLVAQHLQTAGDPRRAAEAMAKVAPTMQQAIEAVPDGPMTNVIYTQYLIQQRRDGAPDVTDQQVRDAVRRVVELVAQADDQWLVLEASQVVLSAGTENDGHLAIDLLYDFVEQNPAAAAHKYFLAQMLFQLREIDEAAELADQLVDAEPLRVSFISQMQLMLRRLSASLLVDVEYWRFMHAQADGREPDIDAVTAARQRLATFVVDVENDSHLIRADAKVAMLKQDFDAAAGGFERLIREGSNDVEVHVLSAFAMEEIGQIGLAHERMVSALALRANNPFLLFRKARLEFQMGRLEQAAESIAQYQQLSPDDPEAGRLARAIEATRSGEDVPIDDPVILALRDAEQAMNDGQFDTARATIDAAMAQLEQEDMRLLNAAARIAMSAGLTDSALQYVERALQVQPESRNFRQMQAVLRAGDPITAAEQFTESEYEDEGERAVMLLVTYSAIATENRAAASRHESTGDMDAAAEAREILGRAEAAAERQLNEAMRLAPNHPQLIEYRFNRAVAARNWAEAETIANRARDANADRARGLLYRGRMEFHRERYDHAVRAFQQASEIIPYSSMPWRGLAMSYQQLGNFREAQRAYDQAYRTNPNDLGTVRRYLALLVQMGESARAVRIARTAHRLVPNDTEMREAWLALEAQAGNLAEVLELRRDIYADNRDDRENAMRLVVLLGRSEPTVDLLLEPDGSRRFSERRWNQLSPSEQRRLLAEERSKWHREADQIVQDLKASGGQDLAIASVQALLLRMRGDVAAGVRVLRDYIEGSAEVTTTMYVALGQFLAEAGQFNEAYEEFSRALEYQSDESRDADLAMANFLFERNAFQPAIAHFERVLELGENYDIELRVVEAHVKQGQFNEADQRLRRALANRPIDFVASMLQATIAHGQGVELAAAGRNADAQGKFAEHRQALETAERLMPSSPAPHALRARMLLADYHRTGQRSLLNDAMTALGRADTVKANDTQTSLVRIDVHRAMGNTSAAAFEASRLVESAPDNVQFRRLLVQVHTSAGNYSAAVAAVRQAIDRYPNMVIWHELLGNVHAEAGNMREATSAFHRAYELGQSVPNLVRYVGTLLSLQNPDYEGVVNMLRNVPEHTNNEPVLGASYGLALHQTGRQAPAMQFIRRSYERQRELIRDGAIPPAEIGRWFQILGPLFVTQHPREVEQLMLDLSGQDPDAHELLWMGRYWSRLGEEGLSRSTELLGRGIDKARPDEQQLRALLQFEMANHYLLAERYEAAVTGYQRVLRFDPDHAPSLNNVAFTMAQQLDDAEDALPFAQRALELNPNNASVLDTIGWVHFKLGNYSQAEDFLRRSLAVNETAATQLHLAHVFAAVGEWDGAMTRLRRAGELRPDSKTQAEIDRLADDIRTKSTQAR